MRVATNGDEEFRFWLTRRFVKALRPHLGQALTTQPQIQTQANPDARRELLKFEHEQAVRAADFNTPYQDSSKRLPLGDEPPVLTRFQLRPGTGGTITLALGPEKGQGIDLALNAKLIHSILALMDAAIKAAEWDLPAAEAAANGAPADTRSTVLN